MTQKPDTFAPPPKDGSGFRAMVGLIALIGSLAGLGALFFVEVPEGNKEPLLLALGVILGWGSSVVQSEYGASSTGRKAADAAVKKMEERP